MTRRDVTCQLPSWARGGEGDLDPSYCARQGHDGRAAGRGFSPAAAARHPQSGRLREFHSCGQVFGLFVQSSSRSRSRRMSPRKTPFFHVKTRSTDDRPISPEHVFFGVIRDMIQNRTRTRKQGILGHVENPNRQWCTNPSNGILNCGWRAAALLPPRAAVWIFPPRE